MTNNQDTYCCNCRSALTKLKDYNNEDQELPHYWSDGTCRCNPCHCGKVKEQDEIIEDRNAKIIRFKESLYPSIENKSNLDHYM